MKAICTHCLHATITYVQGRERVGCLRPRTLPDGKTLSPPRNGWEAAIERLPQSQLDYRVRGDQCGPEAKNWRQG